MMKEKGSDDMNKDENEIKRIFAMNLTRPIGESGKQQKEVAEDLGFKPTTLNMWCNGKSFPTAGKIQAIADYFGVGKSVLIEEYNPDQMRKQQIERLSAYARLLNPEGMKKLYERAEELTEIPKYKKED